MKKTMLKLLYWYWWHRYDKKDSHEDRLTFIEKAEHLARLQARLNGLGNLKELVKTLKIEDGENSYFVEHGLKKLEG